MKNEEEAMELSGESSLVSNLHNFSFDVSWSTWGKDLSPPLIRRGRDLSPPFHRRSNILSPARFNASSTPVGSRGWKSPMPENRTTPGNLYTNPTVKVSHKTANTYHGQERQPIRRQSFSPMELDQSDNSFEFKKSSPVKNNKRHSDFGISYLGERAKTVPAMMKISENSPARQRNINNNLTFCDFELEDSVFIRDKSRSKSSGENSLGDNGEGTDCARKVTRKQIGEQEIERKSSHTVVLMVILISACIGTYLCLQVGSCSVFDIDIVKLKHKLEDNVFGQHIAVEAVIGALEKFEQSVKKGDAKTLLVMSFHGWTGIGKNFVSKFIAESFYNARVFWYLVPLHFAHRADGPDIRSQSDVIASWIVGNVSKCGVNVFIFDEMDKAGEELTLGVQSAIETLGKQEQVDGKKKSGMSAITVILFLSNSRANQINQYLFSQMVDDRKRELIKPDEFRDIFEKSSTEWYESMKVAHQVDYFVPFLPLAESHVRQCIERDFVRKGRDPGEKLIEAVMNELSFFDMGGRNGQMSLTGCKRVQDKVDLHIDD